MTEIVLIAAVARNGVIGAKGDMPWHVPSDLKHFKSLTMGAPMIMGRKTFQSLPGLLPGRPHLVVSRDPEFRPEGAEVFVSLDEALVRASALTEAGPDTTAVMVIGGGQIYAQAISRATRIELTEIQAEPEGDTVFPQIDPAVFRVAARTPGQRTERDSADFEFVTYVRQ